jgi:hypothetical protein
MLDGAADPGKQFGQPKRLGQVVVGAGLETDDDVDLLVPRRQDHDDTVRLRRPQLPAHVDAIKIGQAEIQKHQVEDFALHDAQRIGSVLDPRDIMRVGLQAGVHSPSDGDVVLHHQQASHHMTLSPGGTNKAGVR